VKKELSSESGIVIAEAALLLPVFVFLSFVLIDIQWMTRNAQAIEYIVTEAARCEAIQAAACNSASATEAYAVQLGTNVHLPLQADQISAPQCTGTSCSVTVSYAYKPLGAWFPPITIIRTGMAAQAPSLGPPN
jgi:Flp pilus assembly protein TadG